MNIVTQKAKKRQRIIEYSLKHGKSEASRKYKEPLSNIKRWSKRYDGTWQSLKDKSRQPHSHPKQHTLYEESLILEVWNEHGRKGIDYIYCVLVREKGYTRSQGGLFHALRRLGLIEKPKKKGRRNYRQCSPCEIPGEKVQIDVKVVPDYCIILLTRKAKQLKPYNDYCIGIRQCFNKQYFLIVKNIGCNLNPFYISHYSLSPFKRFLAALRVRKMLRARRSSCFIYLLTSELSSGLKYLFLLDIITVPLRRSCSMRLRSSRLFKTVILTSSLTLRTI